MKISTPVNPTESEAKIVTALKKIFPQGKFFVKVNTIQGTSREYKTFINKTKSRAIQHVLQAQIKKNKKDNTSFFKLNKQAALHGLVNFVDEEPTLGAIKVVVDEEEIRELLPNFF